MNFYILKKAKLLLITLLTLGLSLPAAGTTVLESTDPITKVSIEDGVNEIAVRVDFVEAAAKNASPKQWSKVKKGVVEVNELIDVLNEKLIDYSFLNNESKDIVMVDLLFYLYVADEKVTLLENNYFDSLSSYDYRQQDV